MTAECIDNSGNQVIDFSCKHGINNIFHANMGTGLVYKEPFKTDPNIDISPIPNSDEKSLYGKFNYSRGYTLSELQQDLGIPYLRIYRRVKKLESIGVIKSELAGGIILIYIPESWKKGDLHQTIKYPKSKSTENLLYLNYIRDLGKSEKSKNYYHQQAINLFMRYKLLNTDGKDSLQKYYTRYLNQNLDEKYLSKSISTANRFNTQTKPLKQLNKARARHNQLLSSGPPCLFLTLTTDPAKHANLMEANRHIKQSWNDFCRKIRKLYGNFDYVKCNEYSKSALPHLHILIYGLDYIHIKQVSYLWSKTGQGKICYVQALSNDGKDVKWSGPLPSDEYHQDVGTRTPIEYITKNLNRMAFDPYHRELAAYWVTGQQIISTSK